MEAKDTILTQKQFEKAEKQGKWADDYNPILEAQAEISFRAGAREEARLCQLAVQDACKAGIKEVVDWINQNHEEMIDGWAGKNKLVGLDIDPKDWQAKLEEWGIKEEQ